MTFWQWALIALGALALFGTAAATLVALIKHRAGRLADQAPQIRVLCQGLIDDPRVLPHHRLVLRALAGYLDLPIDLIPDFIPIIGRLDDALVTSLAIRLALRWANADLIRQHWPGPQPPPKSILRRAKGRVLPAAVPGTAGMWTRRRALNSPR
jgi:uncharacterized membrane protein YkvA (DUF1232 family)